MTGLRRQNSGWAVKNPTDAEDRYSVTSEMIPWRRECLRLKLFLLENSMNEETGKVQSMGLQSVRHY